MHFLNQRAGDLPRHAVTLSRRHWGIADKPVRYVIVVVPPKMKTPASRPAFSVCGDCDADLNTDNDPP